MSRCPLPQPYPVFKSTEGPQNRHMLALQQHEAVTVFGHGCKRQHGEGPTVLGGDSVKLTMRKHWDSTCSRSFEEEPAKTGSHVSLVCPQGTASNEVSAVHP